MAMLVLPLLLALASLVFCADAAAIQRRMVVGEDGGMAKVRRSVAQVLNKQPVDPTDLESPIQGGDSAAAVDNLDMDPSMKCVLATWPPEIRNPNFAAGYPFSSASQLIGMCQELGDVVEEIESHCPQGEWSSYAASKVKEDMVRLECDIALEWLYGPSEEGTALQEESGEIFPGRQGPTYTTAEEEEDDTMKVMGKQQVPSQLNAYSAAILRPTLEEYEMTEGMVKQQIQPPLDIYPRLPSNTDQYKDEEGETSVKELSCSEEVNRTIAERMLLLDPMQDEEETLWEVCNILSDARLELSYCSDGEESEEKVSQVEMALDCPTIMNKSPAVPAPAYEEASSSEGEVDQKGGLAENLVEEEAGNTDTYQPAADLTSSPAESYAPYHPAGVDGKKNNRDEQDDAEVELQRIIMDTLFKDIYPPQGASNAHSAEGTFGGGVTEDPSELEVPDMGMSNEADEEVPLQSQIGNGLKGDTTGSDCVMDLDDKLYTRVQKAGADEFALCSAIHDGSQALAVCQDGPAKRSYGKLLGEIKSLVCDPAVKLADDYSSSSKPKGDESSSVVCVNNIADEFAQRTQMTGDTCLAVDEAFDKVEQCPDGRLKQESIAKLQAVQQFCDLRLRR